MAIQLPTLKRIEPQGPAPAGRIDVNVPDAAKNVAQGQSDLHGLAEQGIRYQNQMADQEADTVSTDAINNFEQWHKARIDGDPGDENHPAVIGLKYQQGDPEVNFRAFEKEADAKLKELSAPGDPDQSWSPETQNLVNRRLNRKAEELRMTAMTTYGAEKHKYDDSITENRVKQDQDGMNDGIVHMDPISIAKGDMSSLDFIKERRTSIVAARIQQGLRYGGVTLDDKNGDVPYTDPATGELHRVNVGPQTDIKIRQDLSKAFFDATDNLIKSDAPDSLAKAQIMKDQFGKYMIGEQPGKLDANFKKAKLDQDAHDLADQTRGLTDPKAIADVINKSSADGDAKDKALQITADRGTKMAALVRQKQTMNLDALAKFAVQMKQAHPEWTETDFEATLQYKNLYDKVNEKDLPAVAKVFNPPKQSELSAVARVARVLRMEDPDHPDLSKISDGDWTKITNGLSATATTAATKQLMQAISPDQKTIFHNNQRAIQELKTQGFQLGRYKPDNMGQTDMQKGGSQDVKFGQDQAELLQQLQKMGPAVTDSDIKAVVHNSLISKMKNEPYVQPPKWQATGAIFGTPPGAPPAGKTKDVVQPTVDEINGKAIRDFKNEFKRKPIGSELKDYIGKNPKRYGQ